MQVQLCLRKHCNSTCISCILKLLLHKGKCETVHSRNVLKIQVFWDVTVLTRCNSSEYFNFQKTSV